MFFGLLDLIGIELAIFGFFPGMTNPDEISITAMIFVLSSAVLLIVSYIAGFGHELRRKHEKL